MAGTIILVVAGYGAAVLCLLYSLAEFVNGRACDPNWPVESGVYWIVGIAFAFVSHWLTGI